MNRYKFCLGVMVLAVLVITGLYVQVLSPKRTESPVKPDTSERAAPRSMKNGEEIVPAIARPVLDTSGIYGRVVFNDTPMPDMRIYIEWTSYDRVCVYLGMTDHRGMFGAAVARAGSYRILAADATHFGQTFVEWPDDQGKMPLAMEVGELGRVSGRTVDREGNPVPYATVRILQEERILTPPIQSDTHGRFTTGFPWVKRAFLGDSGIIFCANEGVRSGAYQFTPDDPRWKRIEETAPTGDTRDDCQGIRIHLENIVIPLDAACTLAGHVINQRGAPMPNVRVYAVNGKHVCPGFAVTGENGAFTLGGLPAGRYTFLVREAAEDGYRLTLADTKRPVPVAAGGCADNIVVRVSLWDERCRGRVLDTQGRPVKGAEVRVNLLNRIDTCDGFYAETDANGFFSLDHQHAGDYQLRVTRAGYADYIAPEPVRIPDLNVLVTLVPKPVLHGQVLDAETAMPVEGAQLELFPDAPQGPDAEPLDTVTTGEEPNGEFAFELPEPAAYVIHASADGYAVGEFPIDAESGALLDNLDLLLAPADAITGWLADANGAPLAASLHFSQPGFVQAIRTVSDDDGAFTVAGLAPGPGTVMVGVGSNLCYTLSFEYARGEEIELTLPAGGAIQGTVSKNGEPLQQGSVGLYCPEFTFSKEFVCFDTRIAEGAFQLDNVPPGTHMIEIEEDDPYLSHVQEVSVSAGAETVLNIDLTQGAGSVEGVLTLNGVPCENSWVLVKTGAGAAPFAQTILEVQPNLEGYYRIDHVPAGKAILEGGKRLGGAENEPSAYCTRQFAIDVPENGVTRQDIALATRGVVLVTVDGVKTTDYLTVFALEESTTLEQFEALQDIPQGLTELRDDRRLDRGQAFARFDTLSPGTIRIAAVISSYRDGLDEFPCPKTPLRKAETIITIPEDIADDEVIEVNLCAE